MPRRLCRRTSHPLIQSALKRLNCTNSRSTVRHFRYRVFIVSWSSSFDAFVQNIICLCVVRLTFGEDIFYALGCISSYYTDDVWKAMLFIEFLTLWLPVSRGYDIHHSFEYYSTIEFFRSSRFWQRRDVIYVCDIWFTLKILCYSDTIEDWQSFCQEASLTLCSQSTRRDSAATSTTDRPHDGQRLR